MLRGYAAPGTTVRFFPPFKSVPLINSTCPVESIDPRQIEFGNGSGYYEIIGE